MYSVQRDQLVFGPGVHKRNEDPTPQEGGAGGAVPHLLCFFELLYNYGRPCLSSTPHSVNSTHIRQT